MILGLTLCYGVIKFIDLYEGNNPSIRQNYQQDAFKHEDRLTFKDDLDYRVAIGTRLIGDKSLKYDPKFVRVFARMNRKNVNGKEVHKDYPLHDCTENDYKDFFQLESNRIDVYN